MSYAQELREQARYELRQLYLSMLAAFTITTSAVAIINGVNALVNGADVLENVVFGAKVGAFISAGALALVIPVKAAGIHADLECAIKGHNRLSGVSR